MRNINVTIVCSSLVRLGPTNVIYNMLEAYYQNQRNVTFTIVTISNEPTDSRYIEFENLGIKIEGCHIAEGIASIFNLNKIKHVILKTEPDIVLSYGFRCDCIVGLLKLKNIIKVSSLFNNPFEDFIQFGKFQGLIMARLLMCLYRNFNSVIVCSNFIAQKIQKYKLPIEVIYTGVPASYFVPNKKSKAIQREIYGLKSTDIVWLFIGNLIPRKNPVFLIDTFNNLNLPNHYLMIMGDGPLMNECIQHKGTNTNIILLGAQAGTLPHLQIADYYISSSFSEGFPTAVLEALSSDVIPLLSNIEPHIEMVERFSKRCIFENNNSNSLDGAIKKILEISSSLEPRQFLLHNYSSDIMQKKYIDLFIRLKKR